MSNEPTAHERYLASAENKCEPCKAGEIPEYHSFGDGPLHVIKGKWVDCTALTEGQLLEQRTKERNAARELLYAAGLGKAAAEHRVAALCAERDRLTKELALANGRLGTILNVFQTHVHRISLVDDVGAAVEAALGDMAGELEAARAALRKIAVFLQAYGDGPVDRTVKMALKEPGR